ncbi:phosphoribosylanthranilate isomerase [Campylobacter sp. RM16187]|uniref:phosphoribosylanthranilate isomerase n=1 Tax=Campylobacter sp. RM16187 TaxID=1660063 RepID=UPI0021B6ADA0|nr:phosphoribosylanthranilate isomerase [Campylobacter sp. RM16187]QKG28604.1 phosphoribosylanthranilate isomerase [Campylobacter sp. RM16187]
MKTELKICGIKSEAEAKSVLELGVKFIGVILAKSPRQVDIKTARQIANLAHKFGAKCVGVFVGAGECGLSSRGEQSSCEIMEICEFAGLDVAQIYGEISQNLYANLKDLGVSVWKVLSVKDELVSTNEPHDLILYDYKGKNLGGNGVSFDWQILRDLKPFSFALAGGIGTQNAKEALKLKPLIIDVNSKVEDENMIKIPSKIKEILDTINQGDGIEH